MSTIFDTLTYVKRLRDAGESEAVAEAHAMAVKDLVLDQIATKEDVALLRQEMEAQNTLLRSELEAKINGVEQRIKAAMDVTREELKGDIKAVDTKLTVLQWMLGAFVALVAGAILLGLRLGFSG